ncbi:MAG: metallophosphoesterase [Planctomycetes bacterium]|nr:metallophosphoesterase [Planctomycetota bacterium]
MVSDVHSNREALEAVFHEIDAQGISQIWCLGDVVGYGPDPEFCADLIRARCMKTVRGNHDEALFAGAEHFNPFARDAIKFTKRRLQPRAEATQNDRERWEWLRTLPQTFRHAALLFVHGSPRDPVNEYVYPDDPDLLHGRKLAQLFDSVDLAAFCGHTHVPCVIRSDSTVFTPADSDNHFVLDPKFRHLVNVGSVGQPRDRDPRASWVELDGDTLVFHRTEYPFAITQAKIRREDMLDEILAARLSQGI